MTNTRAKLASFGVFLSQRAPQLRTHSPLATRYSPLATRYSPLATRHSPLATRHSPLATRHSPPALPESEFGDPEWSLFCMRDMLPNATFSGFFAIDKTLMFGITPDFDEPYVNCTYKQLF